MRSILWRYVEWRLRRTLPREAVGPTLGDLHEDYTRKLAAAGSLRSSLWLVGEARSLARVYCQPVEAGRSTGRHNVGQDLRYALRAIRRNPGAPLTIVITFALGTAGVTTMFALVNTMLLQPLPYPGSASLVAVKHRAPGIGLIEAGLSDGTYLHYRNHARSFESFATYSETVANLSDPNAMTERVEVTYAGHEFFQVLGVQPELGRLFTREDGRPGFMNMTWPIPVLLSHAFWQQRLGGDPGVVGRTIRLGASPRVVVGVMPPAFAFPRPETQLWHLFELGDRGSDFATRLRYGAIGRLRPGLEPDDAEAELARILPGIVGLYRDATPERFAEVQLAPVVLPLKDHIVGKTRGLLILLFGGTVCLLLVASANTATLSLLRAEQREREVAIRSALGARRTDLIRLFASDAAVLSAIGAGLGLGMAQLTLKAVVAFAPVTLPRVGELHLDVWLVAFTCALAGLGAVMFSGASLLTQTIRRSTSDRLKPSAGALRGSCLRKALVATQVALALVLLVGSGLMARSLWRLAQVDLGFDPRDVLTVEVTLPGSKARQHVQIYERIVEHARTLPGVLTASAASTLPLGASPERFPFMIANRAMPTEKPIAVKFVMPGFFQTMRTRVVAGSGLAISAPTTTPYECIVSESFARRYFSEANAIGQTVRRLERDGGDSGLVDPVTKTVPWWTIVGVVGDVREASLRTAPEDMVYVPVRDPTVELSIVPTTMNVVIRSAIPPAALADAVRPIVRDVDGSLSIARVRPATALVDASIAGERFLAGALLVTAMVSLFLSAIGVYGVVAHAVRRRRQEIGIRVSLGARPEHIVRMVLRDSLVFVLAGTAVGLVATWAATRTLRAFLFDISATDPVTILFVLATVMIVAAAASFVPARRALRLDPVAAIRNE